MRRAVNPFAALRRPRVTWAAVLPWLGFVAACLLPLLWNGSGKVTGDTADGLVLQPEHALTRAVTLWDSGQSFGAVVDRTYSATFPMAPFFWFTHLVGIPEWVAQRLWFAGLLVGAGVGVVKLMRYQQWQATGAWIAAALYVGSYSEWCRVRPVGTAQTSAFTQLGIGGHKRFRQAACQRPSSTICTASR